MGTRADFYIGKGKTAEWVGSIAWDGYPDNKDLHPIFMATTEQSFRDAVAEYAKEHNDFTAPEKGWPWPWTDSNTTDFAYAFAGDKVEAFSGVWFDPLEQPEDLPSGNTEFPDMSSRMNVARDGRSGLIFIQAK